MVCTKEFLPFCNLDDKNPILTLKGKKLKLTNVVEKRISNKTKLLDQINLIRRCEDNNMTKYFQNDELRDLLQPCKKGVSQKFLFKHFVLTLSVFRAS